MYSADGSVVFSPVAGVEDTAGAYPALAAAGAHVVLAWARPAADGESRLAVRRLAY